MPRTSHIYLHLPSVGEEDASVAVRRAVKPVLQKMYVAKEILGYRLFKLDDRVAAEDEILHHMFDYEAATNKQFPFVYAAVTPLDSDDSERAIDAVMTEQGFQRFC